MSKKTNVSDLNIIQFKPERENGLHDLIPENSPKNKTVIIKASYGKESDKDLISNMNKGKLKTKEINNSNKPTFQITINNINNIYQTSTNHSHQPTCSSNNLSINEKDFIITNSPIKSSSKLNKEISDLVPIPEGNSKDIRIPIKENSSFLKYKKPYTFLWSSIPFISTIFPFLGHISVCSSNGTIHDYFSSKYISIDQLNYGSPEKIINLELNEGEMIEWDRAIKRSDKKYKRKNFSFCGNNSLKYAGYILSEVNYKGKKKYSKCDIIKLSINKGKYLSKCAIVKTWIGFVLIITCLLLIIILVSLG